MDKICSALLPVSERQYGIKLKVEKNLRLSVWKLVTYTNILVENLKVSEILPNSDFWIMSKTTNLANNLIISDS
jgi:hypothetical protein